MDTWFEVWFFFPRMIVDTFWHLTVFCIDGWWVCDVFFSMSSSLRFWSWKDRICYKLLEKIIPNSARNFHLVTLMRVWIHRAGIGWSRLLGIQCHVHRGRGPHVLEGGARIIPMSWTWIGTGWFYLQQMNTNYMIYIKCYMYIIYYILYIHILKVKVCTYYAECFHI